MPWETFKLNLTVNEAWLLNITCALVVHLVYNRFEPQPINFIPTAFLLVAVPLLPSYCLLSQPFQQWSFVAVIQTLSLSFSVFYTTLLISIVLYRISPFHPLASIPGPRLARLSQVWAMAIISSGKRHQFLKALHDEYGPYVRIGPNEISCTDVSAIPHVLGTEGLPKSSLYVSKQLPDYPSTLVGVQDPEEHRRRRRVWNRALSTAAVKGYEEILESRVNQLIEELDKLASRSEVTLNTEPVDLSSWFSRFAFDFMGDIAFGGGFNLMTEGDTTGMRHLLESGAKETSIMQQAPYAVPFLWKIPAVIASLSKLLRISEQLGLERMKRGSTSKDLFHYLSNEDTQANPPPFAELISDAALAMVAGSDTTSTTLASIFFYLLANPEVYTRLRDEVDTFFPPGELEHSSIDSARLAEMPYLNGVINEGLRLQPPIPINIQRIALNEPKWTGSQYLPPRTVINIPPYVIHRDVKYFSPIPDTFWPDRWLPAHQREAPTLHPHDPGYLAWKRNGCKVDIQDVTTNVSAFIPFSYGPANCAGKNLATLEMRSVVCSLMQRFDMRFGNDGKGQYKPESWNEEGNEWFLYQVGKLPVTLIRRK